MKICKIFIVGLFMFAPLTATLAQGTTGPNVPAGNTAESTAIKDGAANTKKSGSTGSTVVPGNNSTVASDQKGTNEQKTGEVAGGK